MLGKNKRGKGNRRHPGRCMFFNVGSVGGIRSMLGGGRLNAADLREAVPGAGEDGEKVKGG